MPRMIPIAFAGCRGWLHPGTSARGVVMCGATGFDGFKTYRAWHLLAAEIAAQGPTVLRFDYPGAGDSLGEDTDPGRLAVWMAGIEAAIDWLKLEAGAFDIHLAGLRLGATLAAMVAERRQDVAGLALLAPVVAGRTLAREVTAQSELFNAELKASPEAEPVTGGIEVAGFFHGEALLADLRALKLQAVRRAPPRVFLLTPAGAGPGAREHFEGLGSAVTEQPFEGYEAVIANDVLRAEATIPAGVAGWLAAGRPSLPPRPVPDGEAPLSGAGWTETVLRCGPGHGLVATLCRPEPEPAGMPPVLVTVAGGRDPRLGWARSAVEASRRLAREGIATLRLDGTGIGDSVPAPEGAQPIYSTEQARDVVAAVDALAARGFTRIAATGICSGGYAALHAAALDPRIGAVVPINIQHFFWEEGMTLEAVGRTQTRLLSDYASRLIMRRSLLKILRGQMPVATIARRILARQASGLVVRARGLASRVLGTPSRTRDVRELFTRLNRQGTRVLLLYSDSDPGLDEVARHLGHGGRWLVRRGGRLDLVRGAGHEITPAWARRRVALSLSSFVRETFPETAAR